MNDLQRMIVTRIISDAVMKGYSLEVFNGEETMIRNSRDEREILAAMETTKEDQLRFRLDGKRVGFIRFVYENKGWDVTQEFTPILGPILVDARKLSEDYDSI